MRQRVRPRLKSSQPRRLGCYHPWGQPDGWISTVTLVLMSLFGQSDARATAVFSAIPYSRVVALRYCPVHGTYSGSNRNSLGCDVDARLGPNCELRVSAVSELRANADGQPEWCTQRCSSIRLLFGTTWVFYRTRLRDLVHFDGFLCRLMTQSKFGNPWSNVSLWKNGF